MTAIAITETVEALALQAWFEAAAASPARSVDWRCERIGDARWYGAPSEPRILVNRVRVLGSQSPTTIGQLSRIRTVYRDAGVARFFLHVVPDLLGTDRHQLLQDAGYERYRGWMKFSRGPGAVNPVTTTLSVRQIDAANAADFAAIVGPAFDFEAGFSPALAALVGAAGWQTYMSFDGTEPAGTGALFVRDGIGYLDFGATHPDYRRRGSQSALLSTRLQAAIDAGCTTIVTMTGEAVPGDEQHSYRNIQKAGFNEDYLRENWIPAGS